MSMCDQRLDNIYVKCIGTVKIQTYSLNQSTYILRNVKYLSNNLNLKSNTYILDNVSIYEIHVKFENYGSQCKINAFIEENKL